MSETLTFDPTPPAEVIASQEADMAESLAIGEELMAQQEGLLAGKYKNAQELEQAYVELQRKLGSRDDDEQEQEYEEQAGEEDTQQEYEDEESDDPTIDFLYDVDQEYQTNGELSEETLEKFSQMSSRELVDAYFRYQQQYGSQPQQQQSQGVELSAAEINSIKNSVGGEAAYQQLTSWAAQNFTPAEVEAFDSVVESGNTAAINLALQALYYRYTDAMGYEGETLQGKPARSMDSFRSQAELVRAMSDPRYDTDPAYRQDVMERLERSDLEF